MTNRRHFIKQAAAAVAVAGSATSRSEKEGGKSSTAAGPHSETEKAQDAVRLAIVGTGQISHRYLKQASVSSRVRFVATCARTMESAKARAVEYGIDRWFDDYEAMLDQSRPDAVVIATPTALHARQAIAAFERGVHVLCEKPMATTLEECREMVAAAEKSGKIFLNMPFDATPQMTTALAYLNESTIGVFTGAEAQLLLPGVSRDNWYYDRKVAGGGAGLDTLVYPVSRLVTLLGPARRVSGFSNTLIPHRLLGDGKTIDVVPPPRNSERSIESSVDDNATLLIEWSTGQQAIARALWGTSLVRNDTTIYGRHGTLWLSDGDIIIHSPERKISGGTPMTRGAYERCYSIPYKKDQRTEGLLEHFVDCIKGVTQPTCGGQQQLHLHEILFRGYDAARSGQVQTLETTFTPWHSVDPTFHDTRTRPI
ncbi:Gfo/Idh/MocA family protein [Steroidobacter flavus]|uniref:Gfo/Idh/MocA family protein n=1 Tax=Steroidobacter flavus TaxID=1842136 RepID=A0ABV8SZY1_9GAMM